MKKVLITGANGFIGRNLQVALHELNYSVLTFNRDDDPASLVEKVTAAQTIFHLAGVNRPIADSEFSVNNTEFTHVLVESVVKYNPTVTLVFTSSRQAEENNLYGKSKRASEEIILQAASETAVCACIYRLPGVFGKWSRPDYNSVVATFCHQVINNLPLRIDQPSRLIELVYIDDVIRAFTQHLHPSPSPGGFYAIPTCYKMTLQDLADTIHGFKNSRTSLMTNAVGEGAIRALYATWLSYLPAEQFSYTVPVYADQRGIFAEILKTPAHGQFSFFTAKPGIKRGGHYHHTKNEKFIVVAGQARFRFEHIVSKQTTEFEINAAEVKVVESIPGWAHSIENSGSEELVVMLWANEIFDRNRPDTIIWNSEDEQKITGIECGGNPA